MTNRCKNRDIKRVLREQEKEMEQVNSATRKR